MLSAGALGAHAAEGPYVGLRLGSPHYSGDAVNGIHGSGSGVGGTLYGGWQFTPNFALEGGWFDLGHIDESAGKVDLRGLYLDAVGKYEIAPKWSLRGSIGVAEGRFDTSFGDNRSPALQLGLGVEYEVNKTVAVSLGYDHYHFSDAFDGKPNVGTPVFGLKVGF